MRPAVLLLCVAGLILGLAAQTVADRWEDPGEWIPYLAVGWLLIACGVIGLQRRPANRIPWLLAAAGIAWFLPSFATLDVAAIAWLAGRAVGLDRALLVHAVLSFPTGRLTSWLDRGVIAGAYVATVLPAVSLADRAALGALVIVAALVGAAQSLGPARRARFWALPAAVAFGLVLIGVWLARARFSGVDVDAWTLTAYQLTIAGVGVALLVGLIRAPWTRAPITDLVVELGDAPAASVRDALARALGDPSLEVGYRSGGDDRYLDARGRPLAIPSPGTGRAVTRIEVDGRPVGALIHDPAVLDDPALVRSVADAARLAAANARLQADLRGQIAEVEASRRRLVVAEDDERRRIQARLRAGTEHRLRSLARTLADADEVAARAGDTATVERTRQAVQRLEHTLADLRDLARGLHPPALEDAGLRGALAELAARAPLRIELDLPNADLPRTVASAAYFVCGEGIANVIKHARATRVAIRGTIVGRRLRIEVTDDGVGGADPSGSGLRGLADRVETLGGRLEVESPRAAGTRLTAELPLDGEA